MKLGFIGAGNIGLHICTNLARKGHEVYVCDSEPAAQAKAVAAGAQPVASPRAAAQVADVVFTCLPGPAEVETVALGDDGIAQAARPGLVLVDLTTNFPEHARRIAAALSERGIGMLEAPVGNGVVGARECRSSVICGGDAALFAQIEPLFRCFATTIHHVGPVGSASIVKSIDILVAGVNLAVACEGFILGARAGIDPDVLFDVISTNSGSSERLKRRMKRKIIARDFSPEGSMTLALKDLRVTLGLAEKTMTPMPYGSLLHEQFVAANAQGWGGEDWACIMKVLELATGTEVRRGAMPPQPAARE
ncbi:MAG: NAD(P)-dependent oxidoreductase [Betaproteobacteria bacterium]|nr:NAD(P)-dependent oxidoreductase [Betaproteobacteria bacterium]